MFADTGAWGSVPYCPHGGRDTAVRYGRGVAQRQQWGPDADRLLFWERPACAAKVVQAQRGRRGAPQRSSARCVELAHHTASGSRRPHTGPLGYRVVGSNFQTSPTQELHCAPKLFYLQQTLHAAHALSAPWRQPPTVAPLHVLHPCPVYGTYGLRVPASRVPYVPEAHRAACPGRGTTACDQLRACRTHAHRGTSGGLRRVAPPSRPPPFGGPPSLG